tara:strand:+ start:1166 stop:1333 length:168 start_codon:yes stop_codon:yes gene_type:complete
VIESFFGSLLAKFFYDNVKDNFKDTSSKVIIEKQITESEYINWIYESERNVKWQK